MGGILVVKKLKKMRCNYTWYFFHVTRGVNKSCRDTYNVSIKIPKPVMLTKPLLRQRARRAPIKFLSFLASWHARIFLQSPSSWGMSNLPDQSLSRKRKVSVTKKPEGTRSLNLSKNGLIHAWFRTKSSTLGVETVSSNWIKGPPFHEVPDNSCVTANGKCCLIAIAIDCTSARVHGTRPAP